MGLTRLIKISSASCMVKIPIILKRKQALNQKANATSHYLYVFPSSVQSEPTWLTYDIEYVKTNSTNYESEILQCLMFYSP